MRFLDICRNEDPEGARTVPYLLVVQADLLSPLATRVVVPLYRRRALGGRLLERLMPEFEVGEDVVIAVFPELVGLETAALGDVVLNVADRREDVLAALDLLFTGV